MDDKNRKKLATLVRKERNLILYTKIAEKNAVVVKLGCSFLKVPGHILDCSAFFFVLNFFSFKKCYEFLLIFLYSLWVPKLIFIKIFSKYSRINHQIC